MPVCVVCVNVFRVTGWSLLPRTKLMASSQQIHSVDRLALKLAWFGQHVSITLPVFTFQVFMCSAVLFLFVLLFPLFLNPSNLFTSFFPLLSFLFLQPPAFMVFFPFSHIQIRLPDLYCTPAPCNSAVKKPAINNTEMTLIVCHCDVMPRLALKLLSCTSPDVVRFHYVSGWWAMNHNDFSGQL